ncbi:MAG: cyclic pyranopterin monophosphate synthase MoaC [Oscillospiraceae bacterium]|jgi:cyclic pyranopterin phosphate synthase|nr:cyclic pyranopterin monophosphate synthase MoaC [Oscillospiraceae bacterium]
MSKELSHLDASKNAVMVDIGHKEPSRRIAAAQSIVTMQKETLKKIIEGHVPKGDVISCARISGIMAAKKTSDIIPMCHQIPLEKVSVDFEILNDEQIKITATAMCTYKTGAEMEALTAASTAALTIYDMCKAVDKAIRIDDIYLLSKQGGKSGTYRREEGI